MPPHNDPSLSPLESRLGAEAFRLRLRAEQSLGGAIRRFSMSPRSNAAKMILGSGVARFCTRAVGLNRLGYRAYLRICVVDRVLRLPDLPAALEDFIILHLSDLHLDLDPGFVPALIQRLQGLQYDLAVITGDFRNKTFGPLEPTIAACRAVLRHLHPPVYAVLGNHDPLALVPPLEAAGIRFLLNEHVALAHRGAPLVLAGVDDSVYYRTHDLARALAGSPAGAPRILLSHSPSLHRLAAAHGIHAMLAGHTHGGQVCLPGGHIVIASEPSPRKFLRGPWEHDGVQGYTSSGTGACGVPFRLNCPAEITRHILRRA
jgi:predicted MPP superfamily phosphohydrolase